MFRFLFLIFFFSQMLSAQLFEETQLNLKNRSFGFGGHLSAAPFGISFQRCFGEVYSVQVVFGYIGLSNLYFSNFGVRGKYRFNQIQDTEPYIFAGVGIIHLGDTRAHISETIPLYSFGVGIDLNHNLVKNVIHSYEVGYLNLETQKTKISFSSLSYSFGVHYYYMR